VRKGLLRAKIPGGTFRTAAMHLLSRKSSLDCSKQDNIVCVAWIVPGADDWAVVLAQADSRTNGSSQACSSSPCCRPRRKCVQQTELQNVWDAAVCREALCLTAILQRAKCR